jgi:three-Cys-motif partner protein
MVDIKPRHPQTRVKHSILEKYLHSWGSIIINGLRNQPNPLHFVYIDCNASYGRYAGELRDSFGEQTSSPVFGSPIIGIRTLDSLATWAKATYGKRVLTNAILIEKDPKIFSELKRSLSLANLLQRTQETESFLTLKDTEVALLCEDSTKIASKLTTYTQYETKFAFFLLDPYGPKGIPLDFVRDIIRHPRHDVIIHMPYQDLHKKSGIVTKSTLGAMEQQLVTNYDAMFGHTQWQQIARALDPQALVAEGEEHTSGMALEKVSEARNLETALMNCYKQSLQGVDQELTVKSMKLRFPDRERTMYYLYLTTHDPTGALQMNKVLWDAYQAEHTLRWDLQQSKKQGYQLALFDLPPPKPPIPQRASTDEIGQHILTLLGGKTLTKREIYRAMANEPYFPPEVDKALKALRKQEKAFFDEPLRSGTRIRFI